MFQELCLPELKVGYSEYAGKWFVLSKTTTGGMRTQCLNANGTVGVVNPQAYDDYYFESESSAFFAMFTYYKIHGESFPYVDEWNDAVLRAQAGTIIMPIEDGKIESEVMNF